MDIEYFAVTGVGPDGLVQGGGAVAIDGGVRRSAPQGGCGAPGCACSPGHWISVIQPRSEDGVVAGYTAHFSSREELDAADLDDIKRQAVANPRKEDP